MLCFETLEVKSSSGEIVTLTASTIALIREITLKLAYRNYPWDDTLAARSCFVAFFETFVERCKSGRLY